MRLFNNETLSPLTGETESETETEDEAQTRNTKKKTREKETAAVNAVDMKSFTNMPYPIIVDSGAAETVLPKDWCKQAEMVKDTSGRTYSAANGTQIRNEGHKTVAMITRQGQWRNMTFQVCDVTKPLASVSKICENGHSVAFNPSWGSMG